MANLPVPRAQELSMTTRFSILLICTVWAELNCFSATFIPCQISKQSSWTVENQRHELGFRASLDADSFHSFDMLTLALDYRVENVAQPATGIATISLQARENLSQLEFNAEGLIIHGVNENDAVLPFSFENNVVMVQRSMQMGDTITIWFSLDIPVQPDHISLGYHWGIGGVFTFSEPYGARRWFPCFDWPFDKFSTVTIAVNMPDYWSLAANGALIETSYPEFGRKREVYQLEQPISTYLVMLTCGSYSKQVFEREGIQYRYFVWPQDSAKAAYDWERTPHMMSLFNQEFGEYPFQQYGMVQAELYNGWGAMEHQTFTSMGHHLIDSVRTYEGIVAHELAHQWFGDALSPVDFRNMWLNEGFATYAHALWYEEIGGVDSLRYALSRFADDHFGEDRIFRYAPYDPPPEYLFGTSIYQKSAWVLHMLREQLMGDSLFFAGLRQYTQQFRYGNVDTEDFIEVMSETYGEDLHWFFNQWIYSAGFPELEIVITPNVPTNQDITVRVRQTQTNAPTFRIPITIEAGNNQAIAHTIWVQESDQTAIVHTDSIVDFARLAEFQPLLYQGTGASAPESPSNVIDEFALGEPYPNPFNATITFPFELQNNIKVTLELFDLNGRLTATILSSRLSAGSHTITFDTEQRAAGIYFARLRSENFSQTRKILLIK